MLRTAAKLHQKDFLRQQTKRTITTHHVYQGDTLKGEARKGILDTSVRVEHHVGYLSLNREHRHNTLTPNYIKNIRRSLETLNLDEIVKVIYMTGGKGEHFSNGTDFRTLLHYKREGNDSKIASYLEDLYGLQIQASKINKPILGVAPGHSYNSGAAFLQATAHPTVTLDSKISFNEVQFGFVPHGGSSYYLSRLPGEIGTFLALTGFPITGIDAKEFGIADELVHYSEAYEEEVMQILLAMEFPIPNGDLLGDGGRGNVWQLDVDARGKSREEKYQADEMERARKKHENLLYEEFYEPKDNIPSQTANSDRKYKEMLETYNQRYSDNQEPGYLHNTEGVYQNYFNYVLGYVKSHSGHEYPKDPRTILLKNATAINRCFLSSTLEEITENLKREEAEGSAFAKQCLQRMSANSTLSMKLALKMLRDARNLDYKGAIQNEINVALNKVQDNEFELGVSEILLKPHLGGRQPINPGFSRTVSSDQVQSYFQPNKWAKEIQLELVEKALLPTRFYYEKFSDQVRLWVNEESTPQPELRDWFESELKESLREHGIDIRDRALTIQSAREHLHTRMLVENKQKLFNERLEQLMNDSKLRDQYFQQARDHLERLEKGDQANFYKLVNTKIQNIFEQAYLEKLQIIYDKSKEAHGLDKRRMLIRFKKFLFQSRILTYAQEEFDRLIKTVSHLPFKTPHLTEQWDKTYREMDHPELQTSFLWHLSKAIGKGSLAPPELARSYLTDGTTHKALTLYTFDKTELTKLRADILQNPDKYEKALKTRKHVEKLGDKQIIKEKKNEEYSYWFRVLNEGVTPADSLPYSKQLLQYQDFVQQVEDRALNTLRSTVQRLLLDFEDHNGGVSGRNEVSQFEQKERESKHDALKRLMALVNEKEDLSKDIKKEKKPKQESLTLKTRSPFEIKQYINQLLEADTEIAQVIPKDVEGNPLVSKFREEAIQELYQLIEFALINKANRPNNALPAKHLLQERFASLANPANAQQRNMTNLRILDSFLSSHNCEALVKDAIRLVKPYYFADVLGARLEEEARKVFDAVKAEATANDVLLFYTFNHYYPEVRFQQSHRRIMTYNENRDREKYWDSIFPDQSRKYGLKRYLSLIGQQQVRSVEELEQAVRTEYAGLEEIKREAEANEDAYIQETIEARAAGMKLPFDEENADQEVDRQPSLNLYGYEYNELEEIMKNSQRAEDLKEYLELNEQEIRAGMQQEEWLNVYSSAITQYDLDMQSTFRFTTFPLHKDQAKPDYTIEMQNIFGGNKNLTWSSVGEYAGFLSDLYTAGHKATAGKTVPQDYEEMSEFIVKQLDIVNGEDLLNSQSLFEKIKSTKHSINRVGEKSKFLRDDIKDFAKLQKRILSDKRTRDNVEKLASSAPRDVSDLVQKVLSSQSQYINLSELEKVMVSKQYELLKDSTGMSAIIDKERLFADLRSGQNKALKDFSQNYQNTRLDILSISEARETIAQAPVTNFLDEKLRAQIKTVLDFVEDSLKFVPHSRREAMTLGEYMQRHTYIQSTGTNHSHMETILQNKIQEVLGNTIDTGAADMIDWEFAGVRTNPGTHEQEDKRVQTALAQGKGYNAEITAEATIESYMMGRGANELGEEPLVQSINPTTGILELSDKPDFDLEQVLRDATTLTKLRPETTYMRNYYENELMALYSSANFDQNAIEKVIQKYTELRLKECLLNPEFAKKINTGNNGHIYIKVLRENIAEELKLSEPAKASDFAYMKMFDDPRIQADAEGRYNTQDISNHSKVGLDTLTGQQGDANNLLDKLLGDYFLQKRGQYVASNELLDQLNQQFGEKLHAYKDGHKLKTKDKKQINNDAFPFPGQPGMTYELMQQNLRKEAEPRIQAQDYNALLELDIATSQALQNGKNGLSAGLRMEIPEEMTNVPEYFQIFDARKPAQLYVEDKLHSLLSQIFEVRRNVEKTLSRNDLLAYDRVLAGHLTRETLLPRLKTAVDTDLNQLLQLRQAYDMQKEGKENETMQFLKSHNEQAEFNRDLKNEDALYKFLAYSGMLEKKRREDVNKIRKNNEVIFGVENFTEFYKGELKRDSLNEPRKVNPADYAPKRNAQSDPSLGFRTTEEREADYFREFETFKEKKKDQLERNQLFYVFEQFFSHAKENPDPLNKAQEAIVDYFRDTENTFFFDKNKIQ